MDKKFGFQIIGLVIIILLASFLAFNYQYIRPLTSQIAGKPNRSESSNVTTTKNLTIRDFEGNTIATLEVEVVDTDEKRSKGLGFRESLATNSGMLFIYDEAKQYTYWMKGMQFPIDIMWIRDNKIADILPNIPPPIEGQSDETLERYSSSVEVNQVLETNAGFVDQNNIQVGDTIILDPN